MGDSENKDVYVITTSRDTWVSEGSEDRITVFEQYIDRGYGTLEHAKERKARLGDRYGKVRIAKLVFINEE